MNISDNIPINVDTVIDEICARQGMAWNEGRINEYQEYPEIQKLYRIINSGIPREEFFYRGFLYRLHSSYITTKEYFVPLQEKRISAISKDGSMRVLPVTDYSERVVSFSKNYDYTDREIYYKVIPSEKSIMFQVNTGLLFGIDVGALFRRFGYDNYYEKEQEVLFPLMREYVCKEYQCTPNQFKYYMRKL